MITGTSSVMTKETLETEWSKVVDELQQNHNIKVHNPISALNGALNIR